MVRKWNRKTTALALGLITCAAFCVAAVRAQPGAGVEPVKALEAPIEVSLEKLKTGPLESAIRLTGEVRSIRATDVSAETRGRVLEMPWRMGDRVAAGTVMARLDGSKNDLAIRQASARVDQAEIAFEQSRRKRDRSQSLYDNQKISVEKFDDAVFTHRRTRAELELRRAELASLERIAADHTIRAPYEAFITRIEIEVGDYVSEGSPAFSLVEATGTKASFQVPAEYVASFQRGTRYSVEIPALAQTFDASVEAIARKADSRSRTFEIELDLEPHADLHPGMIAKLSVRLASGDDALFVPSSAVLEKFGGSFIVLYDDGIAREIPVTIVQRDGRTVAISGEIEEGMLVVAVGHHRVQDGDRVVASGEKLASNPGSR